MTSPSPALLTASLLSAAVGVATCVSAIAAPSASSLHDYIVFTQPGMHHSMGDRSGHDAAARGRSLAASVSGTVVKSFPSVGAVVIRAASDSLARLRASDTVESVSVDRPLAAPSFVPDALIARQDVDARWGLDRINQRALPLDRNYAPDGNGKGVTIYVVDSGIRPSHQEFKGRLQPGFNAADGGGAVTYDSSGHGTHTASIAAGASYGVASQATIVPVQVFGKKASSVATVVAGIDWIIQNAKGPSVANMSLGWEKDAALDAATSRLVAAGVSAIVAGGNDTEDACTKSPAGVREAITVASGHTEDDISGSSALGPCIDLYAPGAWITAASSGSDTGVSRTSGTSNAAPHVAGAAALFLAKDSTLTPAQLQSKIVETSTKGVLKKVPAQTINALLYVGKI